MIKELNKEKEPSELTSSKDGFNKSILYVASESLPFCATGGLADVIGSLPKSLKNEYPNSDIRVVLPLYKNMRYDRDKLTYIGNTYVSLSWRKEYCGIFTCQYEGITYYFIDNEKYFKRDGYYGYMDDVERFAFFSRSVLDILPCIDFFPNIIHVNDWQSALVPVYLKTISWQDARYYKIKTVLTIHNITYQGRYGRYVLSDILGIDDKNSHLLIHQNDVNFLKAGMMCADKVVTVSQSYAEEIQTPEGGSGLDAVVRSVSSKLVGIVNGLDYSYYNPSVDNVIWTNYDCNNLDKKAKNKEELQKYFGIEVNPNVPVLSIVSRMVKNKGLDLVKNIMENILNTTDAQFVAVGEGEKEYEDYFKYLNSKYGNRVHVSLGFSVEIGKKIYAGSDIFLMPSISEPCGISQMIASKYGAVPIVREVGGLKDTIKDFGCPEGGNGYTFHDYNVRDFEYSIRRAITDYHNRDEWTKKVKIAMNMDFSWNRSMNNYVKLYKEI